MVYILLAEGFEEAEALIPADLLRRAGLPVSLVGLNDATVAGGHGIAPPRTGCSCPEGRGAWSPCRWTCSPWP